MRRILLTLFLGSLIAVPFFISRASQQENAPADLVVFTTEPKPSCAISSENLLVNPSFEGQYSSYTPPNGHSDCPWGVCTTAQMADGWTPWWRSHTDGDPEWIIRNPEYKPAESTFIDPPRVKDGARAQQYFTFYGTHESGMYQRVAGLDSGSTYRFNIWGHAWSADDDDSYSGPTHVEAYQTIGIDPTGGTDWQSPTVIWGSKGLFYDSYGEFALEAIAQGDAITVFTYSNPQHAVKHNDIYWDDGSLVRMTGGEMKVSPETAGGLAEENDGRAMQSIVKVDLIGATAWDAEIQSGGTLPIQINRTMGNSDDELIISYDTTGLALGTYETDVAITASGCAGENLSYTLPVKLTVVETLQKVYIPITQ